MSTAESGRKNILIIGAGFGGITALLKLHQRLRRAGLGNAYQLMLVNKTPYQLYTPALYEIASIPRTEAGAYELKCSICIEIADVLSRLPGEKFIAGEVSTIDPGKKIAVLANGDTLAFEYALIAVGAEINYFGIPGLETQSYPLKTFEDAVRLRNRVETLMRARPEELRIVIGGGGATGVELSAELINYLAHLKKEPALSTCRTTITLIEASPEILPGFSKWVVRRAKSRLQKMGVLIRTGQRIEEVRPDQTRLANGDILPIDLFIWTGGVSPSAAVKRFGLRLDQRGGVIVNQFLEARPGIYAIGDCASFSNPKTGKPLPGNVPIAEAEGRLAARNIAADIRGKPRRPFRPLSRYPFILAVGGKYALADLILVRCGGFLGWCLKQLVELRYLIFILPFGKALGVWYEAMRYASRND